MCTCLNRLIATFSNRSCIGCIRWWGWWYAVVAVVLCSEGSEFHVALSPCLSCRPLVLCLRSQVASVKNGQGACEVVGVIIFELENTIKINAYAVRYINRIAFIFSQFIRVETVLCYR
jgi:hypothetical protein